MEMLEIIKESRLLQWIIIGGIITVFFFGLYFWPGYHIWEGATEVCYDDQVIKLQNGTKIIASICKTEHPFIPTPVNILWIIMLIPTISWIITAVIVIICRIFDRYWPWED